MLLKITGDSYRGVLVSLGVDQTSGRMYFRCQFVGDTWRFLKDENKTHAEVSDLMKIPKEMSSWELDTATFVWRTSPTALPQNVSLYTLLEDMFKRIDRISPCVKGTVVNTTLRKKFVEFVTKGAEEIDRDGAKDKFVRLDLVMDALAMLESGVFSFDKVDVKPEAEKSVEEPPKEVVVRGVSRKTAKSARRTAKVGGTKRAAEKDKEV